MRFGAHVAALLPEAPPVPLEDRVAGEVDGEVLSHTRLLKVALNPNPQLPRLQAHQVWPSLVENFARLVIGEEGVVLDRGSEPLDFHRTPTGGSFDAPLDDDFGRAFGSWGNMTPKRPELLGHLRLLAGRLGGDLARVGIHAKVPPGALTGHGQYIDMTLTVH